MDSRSRVICENELSSEETEATTQIDEERAAEARRNAYYAEGGDEGGRCLNASSDTGAYSPMLKDNPQLKASLRTAAIDHPLQDDPWGNALVAGLAGGVVKGVSTAAADGVIQHIAVSTAKEVAKKEAFVAVKESTRMGPAEGVERTSESGFTSRSEASTGGSSAGMSTRSATSAPATEPLASTVERPYLVILP